MQLHKQSRFFIAVALVLALLTSTGFLWFTTSQAAGQVGRSLESRIVALENKVVVLEQRLSQIQLANSTTSKPSSGSSNSLSTASVQQAVNQALQRFYQGGQVDVLGIQEIPSENAAKVDLDFRQFQYFATAEGVPTEPPAQAKPRDPNRLPSPEEIFRPRPKQWSGRGFAMLTHYSDGRWILSRIVFDFDKTLTTNIRIQ